jgi:hypothetical protein
LAAANSNLGENFDPKLGNITLLTLKFMFFRMDYLILLQIVWHILHCMH